MATVRGSSKNWVCAIVAVLSAGLPAFAADRRVMFEDFNATWCGPCINSGAGLSQLMDQYPNQLAVMQIHISDEVTLPWGTTRANYYSITAIPNVWLDGVINRLGSMGSVAADYNQYLSSFNARKDLGTNYTVEMGAVLRPTPARTYRVTARVGLEADVPNARTVRVYLARLRDHFPAGAHYRNCLRQMANPDYQVITLNPGQTIDVTYDFTVPAEDWNDQANMRFMSWVQLNTTNKVVNQSGIISYPFQAIYDAGDMNCDGSLNLFDISGFTTALTNPADYADAYPDCTIDNADMNSDGSVNLFDIAGFVEALGG